MRPSQSLVAALLLLGACAPMSPATTPSPADSADAALPTSIRWTRSSAEHRALVRQSYRMAAEQLARLSTAPGEGRWAVILDADETVLDNSTYQLERARAGLPYSDASWNAWVRRETATALPGAADFTRLAHALGGYVVIITNRDEAVCDATRANLARVEIASDLVLCKPPGSSDKNPRFAAVAAGTAPSTLPPVRVLMWIGDNIQDFPGQSQQLRFGGEDAFDDFGRRWIILPNAMYGSWERNPE